MHMSFIIVNLNPLDSSVVDLYIYASGSLQLVLSNTQMSLGQLGLRVPFG